MVNPLAISKANILRRCGRCTTLLAADKRLCHMATPDNNGPYMHHNGKFALLVVSGKLPA